MGGGGLGLVATGPDAEQTRWLTNAVAICSAMICVMMFALGFGLLTPVSGAVSALADLIGAVAASLKRASDQADRPSKASTLRERLQPPASPR